MATVHQSQPMIQLLLSTPDYVAALDLIATTQEILLQELNGVHSFRYIYINKYSANKINIYMCIYMDIYIFIYICLIYLFSVLLRHLSSQLTEMEKLVDKMLSTEFQRYATADLNRPLGEENTVLDGVSICKIFKNFTYLVCSKQTFMHLFPVRSFVHPQRTG